jgi:hypothetical protein
MRARSAALLWVALLCGAAPGELPIGFTQPVGQAVGRMPDGWEPLEFAKIPRHTRYALEQGESGWMVHARSDAAASGLRRRIALDLAQYPQLSWRWKVARVLERGDATRKDGEDFPARVYVTFAYQPERVPLWKQIQYRAARARFGELPIGSLVYVWGSRADQTGIFDSPYAGAFVKLIPVESGPAHVGEWRSATRNVLEDYRLAFGEEPPPVEGVAVMTDTDDTGEATESWYADLVFSRSAETPHE